MSVKTLVSKITLKNVIYFVGGVLILIFIFTTWRGCGRVKQLEMDIAKFQGERGAFDERQKLRDGRITDLEGKNKVLDQLYVENKVDLDKANEGLAIANGKVSVANSKASYYKHLLETGGTITNKEFKDVVIALNKELGSEVIVYQNDKVILTGVQAGLVLSVMEKAITLDGQYMAAQKVILELNQRVSLCDGQVTNLTGIVGELKGKVGDLDLRLANAEGIIGDTKKLLEHPPLALMLKNAVPIAVVVAIISGAVYYFINHKKAVAK